MMHYSHSFKKTSFAKWKNWTHSRTNLALSSNRSGLSRAKKVNHTSMTRLGHENSIKEVLWLQLIREPISTRAHFSFNCATKKMKLDHSQTKREPLLIRIHIFLNCGRQVVRFGSFGTNTPSLARWSKVSTSSTLLTKFTQLEKTVHCKTFESSIR